MQKTLLLFFLLSFGCVWSQASKVEVITRSDGSFQLLRNGEPYYIKGAGGTVKLEELKNYGGNSIRTWGIAPDTDKILDEAHKLGLTVCFGIWTNCAQIQRSPSHLGLGCGQ
jgi:exo-beta-1,3-glucanase (GH17 family)